MYRHDGILNDMSRNHVYIRPLNPLDEADKKAFVVAAESSGLFFPSNVFTLSTTRVMVAERREPHGVEVVAYQPSYIPVVLGSLVAVSASDTELASAQRMFTAAAYTRCHEQGLSDILMFSSTPETQAFASRHGYQKAHDAYRMEVR